MKAKLLHEQQGEKTFVLIFDTGDEVVSASTLPSSSISIAVTSRLAAPSAMLSWATSTGKRRSTRAFRSLSRSKSWHWWAILPSTKAHPKCMRTVGKADGTHGGHLLEAHVRPTLEVVLVERHGACNARVIRNPGWH